mgnify:CR=1 FL=1
MDKSRDLICLVVCIRGPCLYVDETFDHEYRHPLFRLKSVEISILRSHCIVYIQPRVYWVY